MGDSIISRISRSVASGTALGLPFFLPVPEPEADAEEEDAGEDLSPGGAYAECMTHMIASVRCKIKAIVLTLMAARKLWWCRDVQSGHASADSALKTAIDMHTYICCTDVQCLLHT